LGKNPLLWEISEKMDVVLESRAYNRNDRSSFSNPSKALSTNIHLDWFLDFRKKVISGTCQHKVTVLVASTETVDFDSSKLNISSVSIDGSVTTFKIAAVDLQLGSKVSVSIPKVAH
jgi:aminopeptidase N